VIFFMTATSSEYAIAEAELPTDVTEHDLGTSHPRPTIGVRWILILAVLLMVIPAWSFAAYISWQYAATERQVIENAGRSTAQNLSKAIDFRLVSIESAMSTLVLSTTLREGDYARFYDEAKLFAQTKRAVVALTSASGKQIFNTNNQFGSVLPPTANESRYEEAVTIRKTQFSNVFFGKISNRWIFTLSMPVIKNDRVDYVLIVGLDTGLHLGEVLEAFDVPATWTLALLDESNTIAGRKPLNDVFIGHAAHPDVYNVLTSAEEGRGKSTTVTGQSVQLFYSRLKRAPWKTLVGIPQANVEGTVRAAVTPVITMGLVVLFTSV
jgi:hypothetical protein